MNQQTASEIALTIPAPVGGPERPVEKILAASAGAFGAIYRYQRDRKDPERIRSAIAHAEAFMAEIAAEADTLRQAVEPADLDTIKRQLHNLVTVWPNKTAVDLTGYGAQLLDDVAERQPCRYALREGLRHTRQMSKALPSIAEVLAALDGAQARIRNTAWHISQIPAEIEIARADIARAEAFEAECTAHRARHAAAQTGASGHHDFAPGAAMDGQTGEPS